MNAGLVCNQQNAQLGLRLEEDRDWSIVTANDRANSVEGIDLPHQVTFADPAERGIAGHLAFEQRNGLWLVDAQHARSKK